MNLHLYSVNRIQFLVSVRHQLKILLWFQWINEEYIRGICILVLKCCKGQNQAFHTSTLILTDARKPSQTFLCDFLRYGLKGVANIYILRTFISCERSLGSREVNYK